jgi:hypothetical protein
MESGWKDYQPRIRTANIPKLLVSEKLLIVVYFFFIIGMVYPGD